MNRAERRRLSRNLPKAQRAVNNFGYLLHKSIIDVNNKLPVLGRAVTNKQMTFNPIVIDELEKLQTTISETLEVLKNESISEEANG